MSQQFEIWMDKLINIWINKQPEKAPELCADKFLWYETPFRTPYTSKEEILKEWQGVFDQKEISVSYKIVSVDETVGVAKWSASFVSISSNKKTVMDGIYVVKLNDNGECTEFREWFNIK